MARSGQVRIADLRAAERLVGECRELGHDPSAWPAALVRGVARLVDAQVVIFGGGLSETQLAPSAQSAPLADCGWMVPSHRRRWVERYVHGPALRESEAVRRFAALPGNLITRSREQLMSDRDWYRSAELNEDHHAFECDDFLSSYARSGDPPKLNGFTINRAQRQPRFCVRERRLVRELHRRLTRYVGTALVVPGYDSLRFLPRRLAQTLIRLTEGDSEKQAARWLGVSLPTAHEYVTELYTRFGVSTRAELLVRCLRPTQHPASRAVQAGPAADALSVLMRLPPHLRRTLGCLLEGDSEKQAARRLDLSRATLHEYVTELYVRFGVQSRAELLVRCLKPRRADNATDAPQPPEPAVPCHDGRDSSH